MTVRNQISLNLITNTEIKKKLGADKFVKIGIMGDKNARTDGGDMGNAEIGLIHEMGSVSRNIPPRSFLRMPLTENSKGILDVFNTSSMKAAFKLGATQKMWEFVGQRARAIVLDAFATGGGGAWPKLNAETIKRKGSSAPLIDKAQLRKSIDFEVAKKGNG